MLTHQSLTSAKDARDYFSQAKFYSLDGKEQSISGWCGKGAEALGLEGEVDMDQFEEILKGKINYKGKQIELGIKNNNSEELTHAPGTDFPMAVPKSVSNQANMEGGDKRINKAVLRAADITFKHIEKNFVYTRVKENGKTRWQRVDNVVGAYFMENLNRKNEFHNHVHFVFANMVQKKNGDWRSAEFKEIVQNKIYLGSIFRMNLAHELVKLGYEIDMTDYKQYFFDIKGSNKEFSEFTSQRTKEIIEKAKEINPHSKPNAKVKQIANLLTRESKKINAKELQELTDFRVKEFEKQTGVNITDNIKELTKNATKNSRASLRPVIEARKAINFAIAHLQERNSHFEEKDLIEVAMKRVHGTAGLNHLQDQIQRAVDKEILITNNAEYQRGEEEEVKNEYGKEDYVFVSKTHFTTQEALEREKATIELMNKGKNVLKPVISKTRADKLLKELNNNLKEKSKLNKDQIEAAKAILTSKDRVHGIQGYAGTGKTYMLSKVKEILEIVNKEALKKNPDHVPYQLRGLAPSGAAVKELQKVGIKSNTLQSLLRKYRGYASGRGTLEGLEEEKLKFVNQIFVTDEASMIDAKQMQDFLVIADRIDLRTPLMGDIRQLPSVGAGMPVYEMQRQGMNLTKMTEIRRQENTVGKAIAYSAYARDFGGIFEKVGSNVIDCDILKEKEIDRQDELGDLLGIHTEYTDKEDEERRQVTNSDTALTAAKLYMSFDKEKRENTLIVGQSNSTKDLSNGFIRDILISRKELGEKSNVRKVLINNNPTIAEKALLQTYKKGDVILFNKKNSRLGIEKNGYFEVVEIVGKEGSFEKRVGSLLERFQDSNGNYPKLGKQLPEIKKVFESNWQLDTITKEQANQSIEALREIDGELSQISFGVVKNDNLNDFTNKVENILKDKDDNYPLKIGKSQAKTYTPCLELQSLSDEVKRIEFNPAIANSYRNYMELYSTTKKEFRENDRVMFTRKIETLEDTTIVNSTLGTIKEIKDDSYIITIGDKELEFKKDSPALKHIDYSYCRTTHKAQGATEKNSILITESWWKHLTDERNLLVQATRHKDNIYMVVDNREAIIERILDNQEKSNDSSIDFLVRNQQSLAKRIELSQNLFGKIGGNEEYTKYKMARSISESFDTNKKIRDLPTEKIDNNLLKSENIKGTSALDIVFNTKDEAILELESKIYQQQEGELGIKPKQSFTKPQDKEKVIKRLGKFGSNYQNLVSKLFNNLLNKTKGSKESAKPKAKNTQPNKSQEVKKPKPKYATKRTKKSKFIVKEFETGLIQQKFKEEIMKQMSGHEKADFTNLDQAIDRAFVSLGTKQYFGKSKKGELKWHGKAGYAQAYNIPNSFFKWGIGSIKLEEHEKDSVKFKEVTKEQIEKQKQESELKAKKLALDIKQAEEKLSKKATSKYNDANLGKYRNSKGSNNQYLTKKDLIEYHKNKDIKFTYKGDIIIPVKDINGKIWTCQTIEDSGKKRKMFMKAFIDGAGGKLGHFFLFNKENLKNNKNVILAEGFATAASIDKAINSNKPQDQKTPIAVCFDGGNLEHGLKNIKSKYPNQNYIIAADDDRLKGGNAGEIGATKAAQKYGAKVIFPKFDSNKLVHREKQSSDFNDLHMIEGIDKVKKQFADENNYKHYEGKIDLNKNNSINKSIQHSLDKIDHSINQDHHQQVNHSPEHDHNFEIHR